MEYAILGKTGLKVSRLGFGAMRLPMDGDHVNRELAIPMIHRAFEGGVNYIDSAVGYCNFDSQRVVGEALKGWRDKVVVSTKNHYYGEDRGEWRKNLEDSLERLKVNCIDIYNTHGVNATSLEDSVKPRVQTWLQEAKEEGMIGHICTSFHDNNEALRKVVDSGIYESITVQYNLLDRQLEDGIAYARENKLGIVVMGPVGGGRLGAENEVLSALVPGVERIPELALRFVLANPNATMALSGMSTMEHVEENLLTMSKGPLNADDIRIVDEQLERLKKAADLYCTGCNYCMPCPQKINISRTFSAYNEARVYGLWDRARERYGKWREESPAEERQADECTECGECEKKCPQNIPIRNQLKEAHAALQIKA